MSMLEWAKREVEIASKRERGQQTPEEWDYGCACYACALEAFEVLCSQEHSGMSIDIVKHILNRLIEGKPLTPIEDTEDIWNKLYKEKDYTEYQCTRMSSLFKRVYNNGRIIYKDNDRVVAINKHSGATYYSGLANKLVDKIYPITMPYMPKAPYKVYMEDFLTDAKNGDFDTVDIRYLITPEGDHLSIGKFYKESSNGFIEIPLTEFLERVEMDKARKASLK